MGTFDGKKVFGHDDPVAQGYLRALMAMLIFIPPIRLVVDDKTLEIINLRDQKAIPWEDVASVDVQGHPWGNKWTSRVVVLRTNPRNIWIESRIDATFIGKGKFKAGSAGATVISEAYRRGLKLERHVLDTLDQEARAELQAGG